MIDTLIEQLAAIQRTISSLDAPTQTHTQLLNAAYDGVKQAIAALEKVEELS